MEINGLTWGLTIALIVGLLAFDYFAHVRKAHTPSIREAAIWSGVYVGLALLFGLVFFAVGDTQHAVEYYTGYLLEKALSVDNLFVFLVIMASFRVPREYQQKVLLSRLLATAPKVLILDEPTRGVDVGAKSEIYSIIDNLAKSGTAILVISSDLPEILGICDRVLVMRSGQLAGELPKDSTQDEVMAFAVSNVTSATSASAAAPAGTNPKDEA